MRFLQTPNDPLTTIMSLGQLADVDGDTVSSPFNVFIDGNNDGVVDTSHVVFPA